MKKINSRIFNISLIIISLFLVQCSSNVFQGYMDTRTEALQDIEDKKDEYIDGGALTPDTTPPDLYTVEATTNTNIKLVFSEELNVETAIDPANYEIEGTEANPNLTITDVSIETDGKTVNITVLTGMIHGDKYKLTVLNVTDLASNAINSATKTFNGRGTIVIELANKPSDPTNIQSVNITVEKDEEDDADIIAYKYKFDTGSGHSQTDWSDEIDVSLPINEAGLNEGTRKIYVVAKDSAGNWMEYTSSEEYSWTIDIKPPTAAYSNEPANPTGDQSINITVGGTEVISYKYKLDASSGSSQTDWSDEISIGSAISETGLNGGSRTIYIIGKDLAGNWQDTGSATEYSWEIDTTAPPHPLTLSNPPSSPTNNTTTDITVGGADVVSYKYKIDGGSWSSEVANLTTHITLTGLNGTPKESHTLEVIGKDAQGNWQIDGDATTYTWEIDTDPPTVDLNNPPPGVTNQTDTDFQVNSSDVVNYKYKIDTEAWSGEVPVATNITRTLEAGDRTIRIIGQDAVGNWQAEVDATVYTWTIDLSVPTAVLIGLPDNPTQDTLIDITVDNDGGNITHYKYKLDLEPWSSEIAVTTPIAKSDLIEGSHTIYVRAKNNIGEGTWQEEVNATTFTWVVDHTAPTASLTNKPSDPTSNQKVNITVSGDQVLAYKYRIDYSPAWGTISEIAYTTILDHGGIDLANGSHTVEVIARDEAGNWQAEGDATTYTWEIDIIPPTATLLGTPDNPTKVTDIDIDVAGTGVIFYRYSIDSGAYTGDIDVSINISLSLGEGNHSLKVIGKDSAGNYQEIADATTFTWEIDVTAPTATITDPPVDPSNEDSPNISIAGTDVDTYRYKIDSGIWSGLYPVGTPISLSGLSNGIHTLYVRGRDLADNEQTELDATSHTWTVDTIAPTVTLSTTPVDPTKDQTTDITVGGTGVVAYKYKFDVSSGSAQTDWSSAVENLTTHIVDAELSEGTRTVYVIGKDSAGNWQNTASATEYSWIIDITPPAAVLSDLPNNPTNQVDINITVGGTDVTTYKYKIDSGVWSSETNISSLISEAGLSEAFHTIYVIGKDSVGNWQDTGSATEYTWEIDTSEETAILSNTPEDPTNNTSASISVGGTGVTHYKYNLDSGGYGIQTSTVDSIDLSGLSESSHTIEVIAFDGANWQSTPTTYTWTVDLTPPTVILSNTPANPTNLDYTSITINNTDVVKYKYSIDGAAFTGEIAVATTIDLSSLSDASHTLEVVGLDEAGNWKAEGFGTTYTWTVDTTAPSAPAVSDEGVYDTNLQLKFDWTNAGDVAEVKLQIATDTGFTTIVRGGADGVSVGTNDFYNYTIDVNDGPRYYARVKVRDNVNNWSAWGTASDGIDVVGSITGTVKDSNNNLISSADVDLFLTATPATTWDTTTNGSGIFTFNNIPIGSNAYDIQVSKTGFSNAAKSNITVSYGSTTDIGTIYIISDSASSGTISGAIVDANDASDVDGTTVEIKDWGNNVVEEIVLTSTNTFTTETLPAGTYSIVITVTGYFDLTVDNVTVDGNQNVGNLAICEVLTEPHLRVIVQWGQNPTDLDLHVVGPSNKTVSGTPSNRFHVYWSGQKSFNENNGDYISGADSGGTFSTTSLVQDDTSSYGPEAINLFGFGSGYAYGVYTYTVHRWSNQDWYDSSIVMRVFDSEGLVQEINLPSGGGSLRFWKAIKIDIDGSGRSNRVITVVNEFANLTYDSKSSMNW